jgi:hypothetical protein
MILNKNALNVKEKVMSERELIHVENNPKINAQIEYID